MTDNYGVPDLLIQALIRNDKKRVKIEKLISEKALENIGVKPDAIMKHKFNGLAYKVTGFNVWVNGDKVKITVDAYRYYQSGRKAGRTAYTRSYLHFEDLEPSEIDGE